MHQRLWRPPQSTRPLPAATLWLRPYCTVLYVVRTVPRMKRIEVVPVADAFLVLNSDDVVELRKFYKMVGALIGTPSANNSNSDIILSMPLLLLPEMVLIGLKRRVIRII